MARPDTPLRQLRKRLGLNVQEVSEKTGYSPLYLRAVERGADKLTDNLKQALAEAYHVSPRELGKLVVAKRRNHKDQSMVSGRVNNAQALRGMDTEELARRAGVTPKHLQKVKDGHAYPSEELLRAIAEALHVPYIYLAQHDDIKKRRTYRNHPASRQTEA